jgi:Mnd1 HTH domain
MAVKDFIKDLTDENRIHVEKIGSGNWYWCWAGEEGKQKRDVMNQLE